MPTDFLPRPDAERTPWLKNFADKLSTYAAKYGITTAEVTDITDTAKDWAFRMDVSNKVTKYKEGIVQWKNYLRDGAPAGAVIGMPAAPALGTAPTAAAPGGFSRVVAIARRIKNHAAYSEADGHDLGIEGADAVMLDLDSQKPQVVAKTGTGGHPKFVWKLGRMSGLNVYKDSGDGRGYVFYARDNHPDYEDTAPLPAQTQTWKYKFIYVMGDEEVGQFSDPIVVRVGQ